MVKVKICGITNLDDARACAEAGADLLGFNFYRASPRYIQPEAALPIVAQLPAAVLSVGIFVNAGSPQDVSRIADVAGVGAVQLHGDESPSYCQTLAFRGHFVIKALRVTQDFEPEDALEYKTAAVLLDGFDPRVRGGSGQSFDWSVASKTAKLVPKVFLAGGLGPENIAAALSAVQPYGVDACSALESSPGRKDMARVRAFITAVRDSETHG